MGLGQFADLRGGLPKKRGGGVFEKARWEGGGVIPRCTLRRISLREIL